jgi:DNA transposition AAA+ family ATPase
MNVTKFTLSSGKVIYLREPRIEDTENAAQVAGKKASAENQAHLMILIQKEMLKSLLVKVDEKELKLVDKEDLNKLFTYKEYGQALKALQMITGDEAGNGPIPEFETSGEQ